jgi:hemerythrin-like domain-containing protein
VCEYCGCQALAPIEELTREHDSVLGLISQARAAWATGETGQLAKLARQIAAVLGPHTEVEEQGLFPALETDFPDHIATLKAEHRHIESVLEEASAATPDDPAWPGRFTAALQTLRRHIFAEQDGVFPAALASLKTADWEAVEAVRVRAGSALPQSHQGR